MVALTSIIDSPMTMALTLFSYALHILTILLSSPSFSSAAANRKFLPGKSSTPGPAATTSISLPLYGNVYPDGVYLVALFIGNPAKPFFFDVDTGSDFTWVQSDAPCKNCYNGPNPLYRPQIAKFLLCNNPTCTDLKNIVSSRCEATPTEICDYSISYVDQSSSSGVATADVFPLTLANGSLIRPELLFGCGDDQRGQTLTSVDGVLGLGQGKLGIMSQLRGKGVAVQKVIGHCLSSKGGGYLLLGYDSSKIPPSGVTWIPMANTGNSAVLSDHRKHYYVNTSASLFYGDDKQPTSAFALTLSNPIFDSGTSYTYFPDNIYGGLVSLLRKDLIGKPLREAPEDGTLPLCWKKKDDSPFRSADEYRLYFEPLRLCFAPTSAQLEIPPESYLITTDNGNACFGILSSEGIGMGDITIVGDISMQDLLVVYDEERQMIGWVRANCK